MRNKIIVVGAIAFIAYIFGSRAIRVSKNPPETVRAQAERLLRDPKAKKGRAQAAKKAKKKVEETGAKLKRKAAKAAK